MLELCVSCVACVSSGRRAPVRLLREALPPAGPSVPAVRTIPSACQAGSAWSPPHHLQMAWQCHCHTCNLRCSQDCPLSPSPDSANSAMVFQTPFYGRKPPFFYNFMASLFMYCPLAARTRHCLLFYTTLCQKMEPPPFLNMDTTA